MNFSLMVINGHSVRTILVVLNHSIEEAYPDLSWQINGYSLAIPWYPESLIIPWFLVTVGKNLTSSAWQHNQPERWIPKLNITWSHRWPGAASHRRWLCRCCGPSLPLRWGITMANGEGWSSLELGWAWTSKSLSRLFGRLFVSFVTAYKLSLLFSRST